MYPGARSGMLAFKIQDVSFEDLYVRRQTWEVDGSTEADDNKRYWGQSCTMTVSAEAGQMNSNSGLKVQAHGDFVVTLGRPWGALFRKYVDIVHGHVKKKFGMEELDPSETFFLCVPTKKDKGPHHYAMISQNAIGNSVFGKDGWLVEKGLVTPEEGDVMFATMGRYIIESANAKLSERLGSTWPAKEVARILQHDIETAKRHYVPDHGTYKGLKQGEFLNVLAILTEAIDNDFEPTKELPSSTNRGKAYLLGTVATVAQNYTPETKGLTPAQCRTNLVQSHSLGELQALLGFRPLGSGDNSTHGDPPRSRDGIDTAVSNPGAGEAPTALADEVQVVKTMMARMEGLMNRLVEDNEARKRTGKRPRVYGPPPVRPIPEGELQEMARMKELTMLLPIRDGQRASWLEELESHYPDVKWEERLSMNAQGSSMMRKRGTDQRAKWSPAFTEALLATMSYLEFQVEGRKRENMANLVSDALVILKFYYPWFPYTQNSAYERYKTVKKQICQAINETSSDFKVQDYYPYLRLFRLTPSAVNFQGPPKRPRIQVAYATKNVDVGIQRNTGAPIRRRRHLFAGRTPWTPELDRMLLQSVVFVRRAYAEGTQGVAQSLLRANTLLAVGPAAFQALCNGNLRSFGKVDLGSGAGCKDRLRQLLRDRQEGNLDLETAERFGELLDIGPDLQKWPANIGELSSFEKDMPTATLTDQDDGAREYDDLAGYPRSHRLELTKSRPATVREPSSTDTSNESSDDDELLNWNFLSRSPSRVIMTRSKTKAVGGENGTIRNIPAAPAPECKPSPASIEGKKAAVLVVGDDDVKDDENRGVRALRLRTRVESLLTKNLELDDSMLYAYLESFGHDVVAKSDGTKYVGSPYFPRVIDGSLDDRPERAAHALEALRWPQRKHFEKLKTLYFPLHHGGNHWLAVQIDIDAKTIDFFDSMRPREDQEPEYATKRGFFGRAVRYLSKMTHPEADVGMELEEWTCRIPCCPQQPDAWSCGLWTAHALKRLAEATEPLHHLDDDMSIEELREHFVKAARPWVK
eukprot:TRINITY_DN59_c0_g1_i25.p1 TRINITY_DN59_c0_g1~~TRINITY_DN59_c0_g1_i25.p1  ORF type:complete len:1038 (-),score=30.68 TRINITY_DN59_c0_g1_i25:236-3349(-)